MAKEIALHDYLEIDQVVMSNMAREISTNFEHERVDVSGFSASGKDEFLPGNTTQEITVEFYGMHGSNEVFQVLYPLFRDKTLFEFVWRKNQNSSVSATNPELRGNAKLFTWPDQSTRGDVRTLTLVFQAGDDDGFEYHYT